MKTENLHSADAWFCIAVNARPLGSFSVEIQPRRLVQQHGEKHVPGRATEQQTLRKNLRLLYSKTYELTGQRQCTAFIQALGKRSQEDLHEFESCLVYRMASRLAKARLHTEKAHLKKPKGEMSQL